MQPGLGTAVDMAAQGLGDAGPAGARLLEAQGLGGNWNEDVWPSPFPFYKSVGQLIGLGSRRATASLISLL